MIQDYLENTASSFPAHPAIISKGGSTSFAELAAMARSACVYFQEEGLRKGDAVLLLLDNGPEYAALFFGILMAGGVVVPLNPGDTSDSVRYVAADCSAKFYCVTERALSVVPKEIQGGRVLTEGSSPGGYGRIRDAFLKNAVRLREWQQTDHVDLALVLYTSGTTGTPKGVMLSHSNLEANTRSILGYLPLMPGERTLCILPFYYSYGNSLLLTHICSGATLVVENRFAFIDKALATMKKHCVSGFSGVPSHYSLLLKRSRFLSHKWPHLRYMTCAGGGLSSEQIRTIRKSLPHVRFHVMYGQTEASARLSCLDPALVDEKADSIGKGIPGVELRVVDKNMREVQPEEIGEIVARGENIMLGYLGDPEGTEEVIRDGWLHTGDLATVDEDGFIYIRGREKEFIKSGGYRICPKQVEDVLLNHPSVLECAVVGVPDEIFGEMIVAFVTCGREMEEIPEKDSILAYAREKLPHHIVPQAVHLVDAIPKTATGKVKRLDLREMACRKGWNTSKRYSAPRLPFPGRT